MLQAETVHTTLRKSYRCLQVALILAALAGASVASAQIATATIAGVVTDETGASVPGVTITVRNVATGTSRSATTGAAGRYQIPALSAGTYELRAELQNFKTLVRTGVEEV